MNNDRRKRIAAIQSDLNDKYAIQMTALVAEANAAIDAANEAVAKVRDLATEMKEDLFQAIDEIKEEEQETFDNMPESLQNSERGEMAQAAIENLESAASFFDGLDPDEAFKDIDQLEEPDLSEPDGNLDDAAQ